jgi:hypothetical protein
MVTVVSVPVRVSIPVRVAPPPARVATPVTRTSSSARSLNATEPQYTPPIINPALSNAYWVSRSSSGEPDKDGCISFLSKYDAISATTGERAAYDNCMYEHNPDKPIADWVLPLTMAVIFVVGLVTIFLATNKD